MATFNLTDNSELFKETYGPLSENVYNSANVLLGRTKKSFNFTGKRKVMAIPQSFTGGVGSGILPTANHPKVEDAIITAKRMYSRIEIERESMKASADDKGAFVRATRWQVQKGVESWMRNMSRALFGNGDGSVARGDGATNVSGQGTTGDPYIVRLNADTKEANIEEQDYWHFDSESGPGALLEVVDYDPATRDVSLVGASTGLDNLNGDLGGPAPVPTGTYFYMQNARDNDPQGLRGILTATSGTLYSVPVTRRWSAGVNEAAAGAGITTDMLNEDMLEIERKSGKVPRMIVASYSQYRKVLNLLEDHKRYDLSPRASNLKGHISFSGVEFMSSRGPIPVFPERFVEDDTVYYLNDNHLEICHRPGFGWFDEDGTVFLRKADSDDYEARYGGYLEFYVEPNFHGIRTGLAT
jgi:hypothetical protein